MDTILIIEDDEAILATYALSLENAGYLPLTAVSGAVGLNLARIHLPALILCDVNMPGMNGWEVLRALRQDSELADTQFVLMTGNTRDITPRSGMEGGADDFLVKPFGQNELLLCVKARLRRKEINYRLAEKAVSELRSNLRSTLPHELFTPLSGMLGLVELLRDEDSGLSAEERTDFLDEIQRSGWRLHRTLRNYLFALELESSSPLLEIFEPVSSETLHEALNTGIEDAARRHQRMADISVQLAPCSVMGSAGELSILVEELVDNACAYSRVGTSVRVQLEPTGTLTVIDEGRGLSEAQIHRIGAFNQFDRKKFEQQGLGLGLFLVQKIATRCEATFAIESQLEKGTRVCLNFKLSSF